MKLSLISDILSSFKSKGTVTGVDIEIKRLNICKNLIKKYKTFYNTRLFKIDGVHFNISQPYFQNKMSENTIMPFYAPKYMRKLVYNVDLDNQDSLYDKVMIY